MPTKRKARSRPWRARFTPETLALFQELELTPKRKRKSREFRAGVKALMCGHLDLGGEFWAMLSVLDDSSEPNCPPHLYRYGRWFYVHEVRLQLLQALAESAQRDGEPAPLLH
jgi:hypothetical protein